jgi:hypothetical protein
MIEKTFTTIEEALKGDHPPLARKVLEYSQIMKQLVDKAKEPGFNKDSWAPLAELIALDEFERVGCWLEVQRWPEYVEFLTQWAMHSQWECSFRRVTEKDGVVFLELEERSVVGEHKSAVFSCTVYEFNDAGKLKHLDIVLAGDF